MCCGLSPFKASSIPRCAEVSDTKFPALNSDTQTKHALHRHTHTLQQLMLWRTSKVLFLRRLSLERRNKITSYELYTRSNRDFDAPQRYDAEDNYVLHRLRTHHKGRVLTMVHVETSVCPEETLFGLVGTFFFVQLRLLPC